MKRRTLLGGSVAGGMALAGAQALGSPSQTQAADSARSALPPGVIPSAYRSAALRVRSVRHA